MWLLIGLTMLCLAAAGISVVASNSDGAQPVCYGN